ncbi:MAG: hypothetical protein ACYCXT_13475 [Acidiferrobacteraceae bacterium]
MKFLFWLLLAANVGLWMWVHWEAPLPLRPQAPVHAHEIRLLSSPGVIRVPRLVSGESVPRSATASAPGAGSALTAPPRTATRAASALRCYATKPLPRAALAAAAQRLKVLGIPYHRRTHPHPIYQVASPPLSHGTDRMLRRRLRAFHVTEVYRFIDKGRPRISFGVFRSRLDALRQAHVLTRQGFSVQILKSGRSSDALILGPLRPALKSRLARLHLLHLMLHVRRCAVAGTPARADMGTMPRGHHATLAAPDSAHGRQNATRR